MVLSVAFSNLTACTKTTDTNSPNSSKIEISNTAKPADQTANTVGDNAYPPAPEVILQTENKDLEGKTLKLDD